MVSGIGARKIHRRLPRSAVSRVSVIGRGSLTPFSIGRTMNFGTFLPGLSLMLVELRGIVRGDDGAIS
jgi:hypothetical protein